MPNAPTTNSRLATLERLHNSQEIDIIQKSDTGESEFGETFSTSTTTTTAIVPTPSESRDPSFYGVGDTDISIEFIIDSTVSVSGGGGRLADEVDADQDGTGDYVVLTAVDLQNGLQTLACADVEDVS